MEEKGEPSNLKEGGKSDVEELLGRLNLHEEEADEFVWEEEAGGGSARSRSKGKVACDCKGTYI
jgi:hypothetical protein